MTSHPEGLRQRAKSGDADAQFQLATYFHSQGDPDQAITWLLQASSNGHALAMTNLGICYYFGDGVKQSYKDAFPLFQQASQLGDISATYYVGLGLLNGHGVQENAEKGFSILLECAKNGMPWAQFSVAECYKDGIGIELDLFEAVSWYVRAAKQGIQEAGEKFNEIYYSTHFADHEGNQRFFWFEIEAMNQRDR